MGSFRSSASQTTSASGNGVGNKPAGVADGDLLIACLASSLTTSPTPPAGWDTISTENGVKNFSQATLFSNGCGLYWKKASSEPSTWTWTGSSREWIIDVVAFQNINWPRLTSGGAPVEVCLFDIGCIFSRTSTTIAILDEPSHSDLTYDHYFAVMMPSVQEAAATRTLSAPSAYMTQLHNNSLVGVSMLTAYAELTFQDASDNTAVGPSQVTIDAASGTGRGYMVLIGDPLAEVSGKNLRAKNIRPPKSRTVY